MIHDTLNIVFYAISNITLLWVSIKHSNLITNNPAQAETIYPDPYFGLTITSLFCNLGLVIFGLLILGNLNDFLLQRSLNLIGACQKLRIVSETYNNLVSISYNNKYSSVHVHQRVLLR